MVFFTCDGCGESVKKPSVQKHKSQCRRSFKLTCMDCSKDFYGDEYNTHIKCISEEQKYAGAGPAQNKNEKKQEEWVSLVQDAIKSAVGVSPAVKQMLEYISSFDNIPRKQVKFLNFLKSSQNRNYNENIAKQAWALISKELEKIKIPPPTKKAEVLVEAESPKETAPEPDTAANGHEQKLSKREKKEERRKEHDKAEKKDKKKDKIEEVTNGDGQVEHKDDGSRDKKSKGKKRRRDEEHVEITETETFVTKKKKKSKKETDNGYLEDISMNMNHIHIEEVEELNPAIKKKFRWPESAASILQTQPDKELSLKKIKKKLMAEYIAVNGDDCEVDEIWGMGLKRLGKNSGFRVEKDKIRLL